MAEPIPAVERMLLNALLKNPEARAQVLPRLKNMRTVEGFRTGPIFQAIFQLAESGDDWSYPSLEARLEDSNKNLLASTVLADQMGEQETSLEQALACVQTLDIKEREAHCSDLRSRARAAERAGDLKEALRVMDELNRAERQPGAIRDRAE